MRVSIWMLAGSGALAALLLAAGVVALLRQGPSPEADLVASVDGDGITRAAFDEYAAVFVDPAGKLEVGRDDVLLSLVNQTFISREASRLGIDVPDADVDQAVAAWEHLHISDKSLTRSGGTAGLRARFRAFLASKLVRESVVGYVTISDAAVRRAYQTDMGLAALSFEEVAADLRGRLTEAEGERRWKAWLHRQRECSNVEILDASFGLVSATRQPDCDVRVEP